MNNEHDACLHEAFCPLKTPVCMATDFADHCLMKKTAIESLPLLRMVKNSLETDFDVQEG